MGTSLYFFRYYTLYFLAYFKNRTIYHSSIFSALRNIRYIYILTAMNALPDNTKYIDISIPSYDLKIFLSNYISL